MRHCPFRDCTEQIQDTMFACSKHWNTLNWRQKRAIRDAYEAYLTNQIDKADLLGVQQAVLDEVQGVTK